ncbi:MAG: EamA family transporter [Bacteroidales bacterium]|nr:EamA family transporter [Bacteroidales bacterium]
MQESYINSKKNAVEGHVALILANTIFGLGVPVSKLLLEQWVSPMGYIVSRSIGAALIFWVIQLFLPREKVNGKDLIVIIAGGLLGFAISQTLTAWALYYTTPVNFAILAAMTPIAVLLLTVILRMERITWLKSIGVIAAIAGALLLALPSSDTSIAGQNDKLGIFLAVLAVITWAIYVVMTRKVSAKYSPVTQMKWMFLVSALVTIPIMLHEGAAQPLYSAAWNWAGVTEMAFIVICATVLGYFMIPFALKRIQATTVSIYTNLQPIITMLVAIALGQDHFSWLLVASCALVLTGGWLATK